MCDVATVGYPATNTARTMWLWTVTRESYERVSVCENYVTETSSLSLTDKKSESLGEAGTEPGTDSEVYGHGDSLLRERLQRAEEVSAEMMLISSQHKSAIRLVMHILWRMQSCRPNLLKLMQRFRSCKLTSP